MRLRVRSYREQDQDSIIELWEKVFPGDPPHNNPVRDRRTRQEVPPELFLVALEEDEIIGTVMAGFDGQQGWVYYLGVDPEYRRQGIGTALMKRIEATLIGMGCPEVHLQIWAHKDEVQAFYESLGYYPEDRLGMMKKF